MPWAYCRTCGIEISDWREAFRGCHKCDDKYYEIDDHDAMEILNHLIDEIDELKEKVQCFERVEEWLWDNHHENCLHRQRSQRQGMGDGCNISLHGCSRSECGQFPQRKEDT